MTDAQVNESSSSNSESLARWPLLQGVLDRAERVTSPGLGRVLRSAVVRLALVWLSLAIVLVMFQMGLDSIVKSIRRN